MHVMRLVIWALFALQLLRPGDQPGAPASGRVRICLWDGRGSRNPIWVDSFRFCSGFFLRFFSRWCVEYHRLLLFISDYILQLTGTQ
jgi:hypothetical protein